MNCPALELDAALVATSPRDVIQALHDTQDALADLMNEVFDDLEALGAEVEVRGQLLDDTRRQVATQATELDALRRAEANVRAELTAVRGEVDNARQQLAELPAEAAQLREELHSIELERGSLEAELEALRVRGAELADHLAEVKRQTAEERAEWSGELKHLRRTLERQAELLSDRLAANPKPEHSPHHAPAGHVSTDGAVPPLPFQPAAKDAVLGSVMAQFELLQRDRQRRREPRTTN